MRILVSMVILLSLAPARAADDLDLSSPTAAIRSYANAINEGDIARARKCVEASSKQDNAIVSAGIDYVAAMQKLKKSVIGQFGENADKNIEELFTQAPADMIDQVVNYPDALKETMDGERATVAAGTMEYTLKKIDEEWKISVTEMMKDTPAKQRQGSMLAFVGPTKVMNEIAEEVKNGKYKDVDELKEAFKTKLAAAKQKPASRPATKP